MKRIIKTINLLLGISLLLNACIAEDFDLRKPEWNYVTEVYLKGGTWYPSQEESFYPYGTRTELEQNSSLKFTDQKVYKYYGDLLYSSGDYVVVGNYLVLFDSNLSEESYYISKSRGDSLILQSRNCRDYIYLRK